MEDRINDDMDNIDSIDYKCHHVNQQQIHALTEPISISNLWILKNLKNQGLQKN